MFELTIFQTVIAVVVAILAPMMVHTWLLHRQMPNAKKPKPRTSARYGRSRLSPDRILGIGEEAVKVQQLVHTGLFSKAWITTKILYCVDGLAYNHNMLSRARGDEPELMPFSAEALLKVGVF